MMARRRRNWEYGVPRGRGPSDTHAGSGLQALKGAHIAAASCRPSFRARAPSPLRGGLVVAGLASAAWRKGQHSVKLCKEEVWRSLSHTHF